MIVPDWPAPANVAAASTTRRGGFSRGPWSSFNLADHVGDDAAAVRANRRRLRERLDLPAEPCWLSQVHGAGVVEAGDACSRPPRADASVARAPGRVSVVLTADCLPALFCDRAGRCVAAAHAGWRGLAAGVLEQTVASMGVDPGDILVWLGPAIGPAAFEVGAEVRTAFVNTDPAAAEAFEARPGERWLADLHALARLRLAAAGVDAVYGGGRCTWRERDTFYSYRRDGVTGRMASLVWLR